MKSKTNMTITTKITLAGLAIFLLNGETVVPLLLSFNIRMKRKATNMGTRVKTATTFIA